MATAKKNNQIEEEKHQVLQDCPGATFLKMAFGLNKETTSDTITVSEKYQL